MAHLRWNGPAIGRGRQVEAGGELEKIGKATDVFALGAILCEILTGSPPYQHGEDDPLGEAFVSLIVQRAKAGDVKPGLTRLAACESDPELAEMVRIAQDCLAPQPQDRPVDAAHVNHRIANYRADVRKRAEEERVERGKRQELEQRIRAEKKAMRRTRALVVLVAIIAIAAVVVALVFWDQSEVNRRLAVEKDFALTASETRRIALEARTAELRRSQSETETALRDALRREARVALERGLAQCQRREHGAGLLWLVRGLRGLPPDSNDLEHALRANLACWKQPLLTLQKMLPSSAPVNAIAFHPSKSWLGVAADDGKVVLWDVVTEKILAVFPHPRPVRAVAFRTDGDQLLTGCDDGCVRLWVPGANASPRVIAAHSAPLLAIAYHPREDLFLTGANDGSAVLWDGTAGTRKHFFNAHQRAVQAVAFAPHGRKALTASHDRTARIWDVTNGHELFLLHHDEPLWSAAFHPKPRNTDGVVTGTGRGMIHFWELAQDKPPKQVTLPYRLGNTVHALAFDPTGARLLSGGSDTTAHIWDTIAGQTQQQALPHPGSVGAGGWSSDGQLFATASSDGVRVWGSQSAAYTEKPIRRANEATGDVAFSSDASKLAVVTLRGTVEVWDTATGSKLPIDFPNQKTPIFCVAFNADSSALLLGCQDGTARLWQLHPSRETNRFRGQNGSRIKTAAFQPRGSLIATTYKTGVVVLWDSVSGEQRHELSGHTDGVWSLSFDGSGEVLLTGGGGDKTARLWQVASGKPIGEPLVHSREVTSVALSTDGCLMATGTFDGVVHLYCTSDRSPASPSLKHDGAIHDLAFTRDGRRLLVADAGGGLRLWDTRTARPIGPEMGYGQGTDRALFSPDERLVWSYGHAGAWGTEFMRSWNINPPDATPVDVLQRRLERITGARLGDDDQLRALDVTTWRQLRD